MLKTSVRIYLMGIALYCIPVSAQAANHSCVIGRVQLETKSSVARVAVRCKEPAPGGISWFAYRIEENTEVAKMVLSILITAKVAASRVVISYQPTDTSGKAWGCQSNCRRINQVILQ